MTTWTDFLLTRGASFDAGTAVEFGDLPAELAAARDAAVVCDLSPLGALAVVGPDAEAFLQGQLTNDVAALAPGSSQYSAWCSAKGRVLANCMLRRVAEQSFEMLLPAELVEPIRKRLGMFVLRSKLTISDASAAAVRIGVGGPDAAACLGAANLPAPEVHRSAAFDGGTLAALPGKRFVACVVPERAAAFWERLRAARAAGFACWRWLTIRAGVPVITPPTQDQFIPQMLNLDALDGVSFRKGCYAGQEIVARTQYLGRLKERLALAHADTEPPPGTRVYAAAFGEQACGTVVNAAPAPGGGADLLLVAQTTALAAGALRLGATDSAALSLLPLPYPLPALSAPRGRIA